MRVVWRGTISFGLVTIPVRLYVATESKNVPSHQIHVPDGGRVQYKRVCSVDGAEVPFEEIGRGYESATGQLVVLDDVDLAALPANTSRSIELLAFLPADAVDPIYLDRSYYVEPEPKGARAYRLMRDALRKLHRIAVAKVMLRNREVIGTLRVQGDLLVFATMLWPDEVREPTFPFLAEDDEWVAPSRELAMAEALVESLSDDELDPARYRDVHRETLSALIAAKAAGLPPSATPQPAAEPAAPDLMSALRASIEAAKQRRPITNKGTSANGTRPRAEEPATDTKKVKEPASAGRAGRSPKKRG